jgi:hypothetical protein
VTDYKLGKLYEAMRSNLRLMDDPLALPAVRDKARRQARQAVDVIGMSIDDRQAKMLDWAEANGYPHWSTVLRYSSAPHPTEMP